MDPRKEEVSVLGNGEVGWLGLRVLRGEFLNPRSMP